MKTFGAIAVLLLALLGLFIYGSGSAESRARFISFMNDLKEAQLELRLNGVVTNKFIRSRIHSCTNSIVVGGTNYQCEVSADRDEFSERGTLAITTNGVFLWLDKKRGPLPLLKGTYPPGV